MPTLKDSRMDLILWRHAEAEEGSDDMKRALTKRGEKQARLMAAWLDARLPARCEVLVSPAVRTQQTAAALDKPFKTVRKIAPDATLPDLIAATGWPDKRGAVLVVGHQPVLGQMAALLLSGSEGDWSMKKGAVWWFSNRVREGETQTVLRASMAPDLL